MESADIPLYLEWAKREHVKSVWFLDGYEPPEEIYTKLEGNGYDFPYIITLDAQPIGYIVCCDLFAYKTLCPEPTGALTDEPPGTYCIDLFLGEEEVLGQGYGTQFVERFTDWLLTEKGAKRVVIDVNPDNKRAMRCYEKAGFRPIGKDRDIRGEVVILERSA